MALALGTTPSLRNFEEYLQNRVSPGTARIYSYHVRCWLNWLGAAEPTAALSQEYIDSLVKKGLGASTINLIANSIKRYFRWLGNKIELDAPTVRIPLPKYISVEELDRVLAGCNTLLEKTLITVLFDTGVRISEALALNTSDIGWGLGLISVIRKGGRREEVNISMKAMVILKEWLKLRQMTSKRVFGDLEYQRARKVVLKAGKRAGLKLTPHMLRHSRGVQMLLSNATLHDVQAHLGHANIATTANIYGQFKAVDLKERIPSW